MLDISLLIPAALSPKAALADLEIRAEQEGEAETREPGCQRPCPSEPAQVSSWYITGQLLADQVSEKG